MNNIKELSNFDNDVYRYLVSYMQSRGFAPTQSEVADYLSVSDTTVRTSLRRLSSAGYIWKMKKKPRAIRLLHYTLVEKS